jgi:DNA-binding winged helix-turn-helix (wHTH) protein
LRQAANGCHQAVLKFFSRTLAGMSDFRPATGDQRVRRRWSFANCVFDEASWSLSVNGQRVAVETKPLELLRALLAEAGNLVTKDELLDRIWPNVTVVEGSLPTAVHKLRLVLNDESGAAQTIETVPRVGYRLAVPVHVEEVGAAPLQSSTSAAQPDFAREAAPADAPPSTWKRPGHLFSLSTGLVLIALISAFAFGPSSHLHATKTNPLPTQRQARDALRRLDVPAIEGMLAAGWNPNKPFDDERNGAINYVLNECEWAHGDKRGTDFADGADADRRGSSNRSSKCLGRHALQHRQSGPLLRAGPPSDQLFADVVHRGEGAARRSLPCVV